MGTPMTYRLEGGPLTAQRMELKTPLLEVFRIAGPDRQLEHGFYRPFSDFHDDHAQEFVNLPLAVDLLYFDGWRSVPRPA